MKHFPAVLASFFFAVVSVPVSFAAMNSVDSRESAVDRALGGMEEGSRMLSSNGSFTEDGRRVTGRTPSPSIDTRQTPVPQNFSAPGAGGSLSESTAPAASPGTSAVGGGTVDEVPVGGGTEEPVAGSSEGSIIDVDADLNVSGGTVDANLDVGVDTEAGTLLELDAASDIAADAPIAIEVDSAESAVIESNLGLEEGINEAPASGEAEAGLEADVDASGESDEPINNPVNGLLSL